MKDNRCLYELGIIEPYNRLGLDRNISYLNSNPLKKIEVGALGSAISAQEGFIRALKNPATLQKNIISSSKTS